MEVYLQKEAQLQTAIMFEMTMLEKLIHDVLHAQREACFGELHEIRPGDSFIARIHISVIWASIRRLQ